MKGITITLLLISLPLIALSAILEKHSINNEASDTTDILSNDFDEHNDNNELQANNQPLEKTYQRIIKQTRVVGVEPRELLSSTGNMNGDTINSIDANHKEDSGVLEKSINQTTDNNDEVASVPLNNPTNPGQPPIQPSDQSKINEAPQDPASDGKKTKGTDFSPLISLFKPVKTLKPRGPSPLVTGDVPIQQNTSTIPLTSSEPITSVPTIPTAPTLPNITAKPIQPVNTSPTTPTTSPVNLSTKTNTTSTVTETNKTTATNIDSNSTAQKAAEVPAPAPQPPKPKNVVIMAISALIMVVFVK